MKISRLLLLALVMFTCACNDDDDDEFIETFSDPDYPTSYCLLSDSERSELYVNFDLEMKIYFEIDSFGHLERKNGQSFDTEIFAGKLNSQKDVESVARNHIDRYKTYYGILNTINLDVRKIAGYWVRFPQENESDRNRWYVDFKNQVYENVEVYDSKICLYISPKGVYQSFGHWYPEIHLRENEDVNFEEAKIRLLGKTLGYADWTGAKEHTISEKDFYSGDNSQKMIVPYRKGDCIEMRLCWKITSKTIWNFYVDVMSGELILNEQTVIF